MNTSTIAAISTAPGTGAIAIVRMSGPEAFSIAQKVWRGHDISDLPPRTACLGFITDADGSDIDQVLMTGFKAPSSFTGEDMIEIACHGSTYLQRAILSRLCEAGAVPAGPGEFSMRAVINGRMDLAQAEGVADLIASTSKAASQMAMKQMRGGISRRLSELTETLKNLAALVELELDFSEEDVEFASREKLLATTDALINQLDTLIESYTAGTAIRDGIPIVIAGAPNAGKSSLLNALVGDERAIVSNIPGTTRDTVEDTLTIGSYLFRITDTAGLRDTNDPIEQAGIDRARQAINRATILLSIIDSTLPPATTLIATPPAPDTQTILILNKRDLPDAHISEWETFTHSHNNVLPLSTRNDQDIQNLRERLKDIAEKLQENAGSQIITNERHRTALQQSRQAIRRVKTALTDNLPMDMLTQDIRETIEHLGAITDAPITTPTLLHHLFANFCIGK